MAYSTFAQGSCALAALACAPSIALAAGPDETIIVTGTRSEIAADELGAAVSVLDAADLAIRGETFALQALRSVPGVAVNQPGAPGRLAQVRIRGAEANQTLVFLDGAEAGDVTDGGAFSFETLPAFDIDRIEIVRGAQSALYGSEAIGGVISTRTKRGEPGLQVDSEAEFGSFDTRRAGFGVGGGTERATGRVSLSYFETAGDNIALVGDETDGYTNWTAGASGRAILGGGFSVDASARYVASDIESDAEGFGATLLPSGDVDPLSVLQDSNDRSHQDDVYARAALIGEHLDGAWSQEASFAYSDTDNVFLSAFGETVLDGERLKAVYQSTARWSLGGADLVTTGAAEHEELRYETAGFSTFAREDQQTSLVLEQRVALNDRVFLSGAVRHDFNDRFEDATTGRATLAAFLTENVRLHGSYGSGIINPTFTELFGFSNQLAPNPELTPETSRSFDAGVTFEAGVVRFDVTWFEADLDDEIATTITGSGQQIAVNQPGRSDRRGLETSLAATFGPLSLDAAYTWLDAEAPDGREETRRPENSASLDAVLSFDRVRGNLGLLYNGEQADDVFGAFDGSGFPVYRVTLDHYLLVRAGVEADIANGVVAYVRAENLTDEEYADVFGYRSLGRGVYGGVRIAIR